MKFLIIFFSMNFFYQIFLPRKFSEQLFFNEIFLSTFFSMKFSYQLFLSMKFSEQLFLSMKFSGQLLSLCYFILSCWSLNECRCSGVRPCTRMASTCLAVGYPLFCTQSYSAVATGMASATSPRM